MDWSTFKERIVKNYAYLNEHLNLKWLQSLDPVTGLNKNMVWQNIFLDSTTGNQNGKEYVYIKLLDDYYFIVQYNYLDGDEYQFAETVKDVYETLLSDLNSGQIVTKQQLDDMLNDASDDSEIWYTDSEQE